MYLSQAKYVNDILRKLKMEHAIVCPTPMVIGKVIVAEGELMKTPTLFRQAIGAF